MHTSPIRLIWVWVGCSIIYSLGLISCSVDSSRPARVHSTAVGSSIPDVSRGANASRAPSLYRRAQPQRTPSSVNRFASRAPDSKSQPRDAQIQLRVEKLLVARDVKKRRAIGESEVFPGTVGSLWSLASVKAEGSAAQLEMRWWHGQKLVSTDPFVVSEGIRWSEWSQITVRPTDVGAWRVEVFYPKEDRILRTRHFKIDAPSSSKTHVNAPIPPVSAAHIPSQRRGRSSTPSRSLLSAQKKTETRSVSVPAVDMLTPNINKLEIARSVKRRRPLGVSTRFKVSDERLWGYIEVSNVEAPIYVWMEWLHEREVRSRLRVRVGVSKRWRTWSWQRLTQGDIGLWEVRVLSSQGETLARTHFNVER